MLFLIITGIITFKGTNNSLAVPAVTEIEPAKTLIIDAGHGGTDGGAVAVDGTKESIINISIAMKLRSLANIFGQQTLLTRDSEELLYPGNADTIAKKKRWDQHRRLETINSTNNAIMISIHQNKYPDSRPFGPQVLYNSVAGSAELGNYCHELLNQTLCPENRRVAMPASNDIYLMKNATCPAILVECGFISNPSELSMLTDDEYQKKLAATLLAAYLVYIS